MNRTLFFLHASMEQGDGIVSSVWDKAAAPGAQGIAAVDQAFPLDQNFGLFTVKNWNQKPPLIKEYRDAPDYLKVHIRHLREKLGDDAQNPRFIFTERSKGYRFAGLPGPEQDSSAK